MESKIFLKLRRMKASFSGFKLKEDIMVISSIKLCNPGQETQTKRGLRPPLSSLTNEQPPPQNMSPSLLPSLTIFHFLFHSHPPIRPPLSKKYNLSILLHFPYLRSVKLEFDMWVGAFFVFFFSLTGGGGLLLRQERGLR